MPRAKKLAVIGFDSISLPVLMQFVERGALPTVKRLIEGGAVTQTWPCFPMETGTNWAALATGASPWVTGCNMSTHLPGTPLDRWVRSFPAGMCKAEPLWTTARRAGKRAVVFDWAHSWPLDDEDGIVHVGEDGRPDSAIRALQESRAYTTEPLRDDYRTRAHCLQTAARPARDWPGAPADALEMELPIVPGGASRYSRVDSLWALVLKGAGGYDHVAIYAARGDAEPLLTCRLNEMTDWCRHTFCADGQDVRAGLRAKLLILEPDASHVHLYLSEIYPLDEFVHPPQLAPALFDACGPFIIQVSRQQVVQGGACDIATYFEEQRYLAHWWRDAAGHVLEDEPWDLFMLKWHGPDWTNHLTMYMIDPRHPMYDPERAEEGWALWDDIMGWGDEIVARVIEAAGPDAAIALVSDHGGGTELPSHAARRDANRVLEHHGWLKRKDGAVDWARTVAYGRGHYVFLNMRGRDPDGIVDAGPEADALLDEIAEALLDARDATGRHEYKAVLPKSEAGRLGVGGDRVGDLFLWPAEREPMSAEEFERAYTEAETGTWDWPLLNTGNHLDDSYFVLSGPGVKRGYRRERPTLITSVAPTMATELGVPVPADADGTVLRDFFE